MQLRAVLFDLDGTLLDIDLDVFLREYFAALGPAIASLIGPELSEQVALDAVLDGTRAMSEPHPGETNQHAFNRRFRQLTKTDLAEPHAASVIDRFYVGSFPALRSSHRARPGAARAVMSALTAGLTTVLATNPIFPLAAIRERMRWADLEESWFTLVTSFENSHACKPDPAYFTEIAEKIGMHPQNCLMVGDDPVLDLAAADVGMRTFYVGEPDDVNADWSGSLELLEKLLPRLAR